MPENPAQPPPGAGDAGTVFLDWLSGILIPDWNALIGLLPILVILGVTGPILSLLALYWFYHAIIDRRGRVRLEEPEPVAAPVGDDGLPIFPANVPYCPRHALIYPPTDRRCSIDGEELTVRCPVDETPRVASQELCRVCGTRYQLGASVAAVAVRRTRRPPEGGAAVA
ncbi:MAG: hypothetical protein M3N29_10175 [Chloroflexota bacterium]|nr:hypothetical protein [Chloroflexota bacterium]